ncbi:MAG: glycosyl hydrolase family 28-related protein [Desulfosporosinus sp.]|nr:glycosyl hydrolase family 28-related protein [Desulfosporosinus sp.]
MQKRKKKGPIFILIILFVISLAAPTKASDITKEEILNQIQSIEKNSTENKLNSSLEELLNNDNADIKSQPEVNIQDFGAKGNGVDSDVDALKKAIDFLYYKKGGGSIYFPPTAQTYVIDKPVGIPKNINLIGDNTDICRNFDYTINSSAFIFDGNNIMEGFIYDGGSIRIPDTGIQYEAQYYHEFHVESGGGCIFYNNVFLNAKGTFIGGNGSNTIVFNNTFGEYGDHCFYVGGNSLQATNNIIISNNTFKALKSTRDAIKVTNSGENIIIANNSFDVPEGNLLYLYKSSDPSYENSFQDDLRNISFTYNTVKNCNNIGLIGRDPSPSESAYGKIDQIKISNNTIDGCTGYLKIGESLWDYDFFNGTNIDISNNIFKQTPEIQLNCAGDGLNVNITNNQAYGHPLNGIFILANGKATALNLANNVLDFDDDTTIVKTPDKNTYTTTAEGLVAIMPEEIILSNNKTTSSLDS